MQGEGYATQRGKQRSSLHRVNHFFLLLLGAATLHQLVSLQLMIIPRSAETISRSSRHDSAARVTLWKAPHRCLGQFASKPAQHSITGFPYALLREASIDRRPTIKRLFGKNDLRPTVRILIFISVHISANLTASSSFVTLNGSACRIDHVSQVYSGAQGRVEPFEYRPGKTVSEGREMTEWQVGITLPSPNTNNTYRAEQLNIDLSIMRYDGVEMLAKMNLPVHCIMGWNLYGVDNVKADCIKAPDRVDGAALFLGSPLYGEKRKIPKAHRELAHMAARALLGVIEFDALFLTVPNEYSFSEYDTICGNDSKCRGDLDARNDDFVYDLARTIESELKFLRVPAEMYSKIHIIPTCRFGTHIHGIEKGNPCVMSRGGGQFMNMFYTYGMVAPYYRWAVSADQDEFLTVKPGFKNKDLVTTGKAVDVLNSFDSFTRPKRVGHMYFPWVIFRVPSEKQFLAITREVTKHIMPRLVREDDATNSDGCFEVHKIGKSAVRCDVGLGFDVHYPVTIGEDMLLDYRSKKRRVNQLITWHARFGFSRVAENRGRCVAYTDFTKYEPTTSVKLE